MHFTQHFTLTFEWNWDKFLFENLHSFSNKISSKFSKQKVLPSAQVPECQIALSAWVHKCPLSVWVSPDAQVAKYLECPSA